MEYAEKHMEYAEKHVEYAGPGKQSRKLINITT